MKDYLEKIKRKQKMKKGNYHAQKYQYILNVYKNKNMEKESYYASDFKQRQ